MLYLGLTNLLFLVRYTVSKPASMRGGIYFMILLALFAFSAFRYRVGCDWTGYYFQFLVVDNLDLATRSVFQDPIWWAIVSWIRGMDWSYPMMNVISSTIFFFGVHMLAKRQPDPLGFLVLLFPILIVNMPMSGIRQGAAIGLICLAFVAFIDRRPIWFAIWVGVAAGIHSSAAAFFLLLPIATGRYTRGRLIMAGMLAVPGAYFLATGDAGELAVQRYVGTGIDAAGAIFRVGVIGVSAVYFFLYLRQKWMRTWPDDYPLASIGAIGMALALVLIPVSTVIADRFAYYLIPIQAMIFARIPFLPFRSNAALHAAAPYVGLVVVFAVWSQLSSIFQQCYLPYQSWVFGFPAGTIDGF